MRDPLDQAVAILKANTSDDLELARFGRTFQNSQGRELMHQRLVTILERASLDSQPAGVIAQIHNDIGVIEISLGNTDQAITRLLDSLFISAEGIRNDLFFTAILVWPLLAYLADRMDKEELFHLSWILGIANVRLRAMRDEVLSNWEKLEELEFAISWLDTIRILGAPSFLQKPLRESDAYSIVLDNTRRLDSVTQNRLCVQNWLKKRLEVIS